MEDRGVTVEGGGVKASEVSDSRHMCHGAGAKVGWIKEYRGLTFTM